MKTDFLLSAFSLKCGGGNLTHLLHSLSLSTHVCINYKQNYSSYMFDNLFLTVLLDYWTISS